jgi:hypothetical protein
MSAPALVGNALVLHSLCYSIAPLPCFPPLLGLVGGRPHAFRVCCLCVAPGSSRLPCAY